MIIWSLPISKASERLAVNIQHIHTWSELLVPLVNMIKEGSENKPALLIHLIFYLKEITEIEPFFELKQLKMRGNLIMK